MPEPTARQKLNDFARRVIAAKDSYIGKAGDLGASMAPHVVILRDRAQAALDKAKTITGAPATGNVAIDSGLRGLSDNDQAARTAAERAIPMEAAQRYLNSKQPLQNFTNPELDAPASAGKFLDPKDAAIQSLRESADIYKAASARQDMDDLRKRLAIQNLTKR